MDEAQWSHFSTTGTAPPVQMFGTFHWTPCKDENGNDCWRVKTVASPPATTNRHQYDLMTYCCFSDFNLKFDFRCPNMRDRWTDNDPENAPNITCGDALTGVRNWGNSGVYIFNSYEVQIHDSFNNGSVNVPPENQLITLAPSLCQLPVEQLCGAVYEQRRPNKNKIRPASNKDNRFPPIPGGVWNTMEIGFMSPRYENGVIVKQATITVKINTEESSEAAVVAYGIEGNTGRFPEGVWGKILDNRYGMGWEKAVGPIVLQEHDNQVEFRDIRINAGWYPTRDEIENGEFDRCWQRPRFDDCP